MLRIGIRELREQTSGVLRRVRERGETVEVTYHGKVVARLVPVSEPDSHTSASDFLAEWERLGEATSACWPQDVSALDAVREGRREL